MSGCYVVFHKQLGDLLLLEPTLSCLRDYYGSPIRLLTRSGHRPLTELMEGVQYQVGYPLVWKRDLYCYDPTKKSAMRSLLASVWGRHFILPNKSETKWFHSLFQIPRVELGNQYVAKFFWENTPVPKKNFRPPILKFPPSHWRPSNLSNESFVLINPTSGWKRKNWLVDRWVETLRIFFQRYQIPFVITSASSNWQRADCKKIVEKLGNIICHVENTSLHNFLWLCSRAKLVLTVDGVASHLAQAFHRPSTTLFIGTSLANWHWDTGINVAVQARPDDKGNYVASNLSVDSVIEKIEVIAKDV